MDRKENTWTAVQMYCPNCGTLSTGYRDQNGSHRFQCQRCGVAMVRSYKSRRQDLIEVTGGTAERLIPPEKKIEYGERRRMPG